MGGGCIYQLYFDSLKRVSQKDYHPQGLEYEQNIGKRGTGELKC